jgi:hypothetical protein
LPNTETGPKEENVSYAAEYDLEVQKGRHPPSFLIAQGKGLEDLLENVDENYAPNQQSVNPIVNMKRNPGLCKFVGILWHHQTLRVNRVHYDLAHEEQRAENDSANVEAEGNNHKVKFRMLSYSSDANVYNTT